MKVRKFYKEDLGQINGWLEARGWPVLTESVLPRTGFIVDETAVGFLYKTDSSLCWMEWLVTNPSAPSEHRDKALDGVIEHLTSEAKMWGARAVFTSVSDAGLIERYKKHGFHESETAMTNMIKGA
jgi:hypothetical protein